MDRPSVKYKREENNGFYATLNERVNAYFAENNLSKKMNAFGVFKAILFFSLYAVVYAAILLAEGNNAILLCCFTILGFLQICLVLNLGHEGVHGSFSKHHSINNILSFTFDLVGISGYIWKMKHVDSHHPNPMILGVDVDHEQTDMFTFQKLNNPPKIFKYQKYYAPILYCFYSLSAIFFKDWKDLFSNKSGNRSVKHSKKQVIFFVLFKLFYVSYILVLPIIFSGCSIYIVLLGFLLMHIIASLSAAIALFPGHLYEDTTYAVLNEHGELDSTWAAHQLKVTLDFGTRLPFLNFFFGGLNYHAVHHLFPNVAHVHFTSLRKIMIETATEYKIPYHHIPSLKNAIVSHWKLLRKHGSSHLSEVL